MPETIAGLLDLAALLDRYAQIHRSAAESALGGSGVSTPAGGLLWQLGENAGRSATMSELAHTLQCDPSYVTLLAKQLEHAGLAERSRDERDSRRRILRLTESGVTVAARMTAAVQRRSPLAGLAAEELAAMTALLEACLNRPAETD